MASCVECSKEWDDIDNDQNLVTVVCDHFEQEHDYF